MTRRRALRAMVVAVTALAACSQHTAPMGPDGGTDGEVVEVEIRNFEFVQADLTIEPGTTVRWRNTTDNYHTVTPDGHTAWSTWETSGSGETFEVTFEGVGVFPYYCMPHRPLGMTGTITVE